MPLCRFNKKNVIYSVFALERPKNEIMKHAPLLFALVFLLSASLHAQVVNTEKKRFLSQDKTWAGNVDFNFGLNRTKAGQTLILNTNGQIQLNKNRNKWMFLAGYALTQFLDIDTPGAAPKNFNNAQFTHLRYNRVLSNRLTWEAFVQEQWDEVHEIDLRLLAGTGPRLQILRTDSSQLFFGALYMYEHENTSPEDFMEKNRHSRLSSYVSAGFTFSHFILNHITYYQPRLSQIEDYRINSETSISLQIHSHLTLRTSYTFIFDSRPPQTVRKTRYNLGSGVSFAF